MWTRAVGQNHEDQLIDPVDLPGRLSYMVDQGSRFEPDQYDMHPYLLIVVSRYKLHPTFLGWNR